MYRIFTGALCALQLCVLLPANVYFCVTKGDTISFVAAGANIAFGTLAGMLAASDPFA